MFGVIVVVFVVSGVGDIFSVVDDVVVDVVDVHDIVDDAGDGFVVVDYVGVVGYCIWFWCLLCHH